MDKLKIYLLKTLKTDAEREAYATASGTTLRYLRKVVYKRKPVRLDGELARRLDENSDGFVQKQLLRPTIWPELLD